MTNEKLTFEEWRGRVSVTVTDEAIEGLKTFHNIDATQEIESALRKEYEIYLKSNNSTFWS